MCPLGRLFGIVECLPGYGFTYRYLKCFISVFEHLVAQIEHCDIELEAQHLVYVCQAVEKLGVLPLEMYGDNIALCLYAFCYKGFLPLQVAYDTATLARTYSGGEHYDVVVAFECGINLLREVTRLLACFVYGHPK